METVPLNPVRTRSKMDCCVPKENDGLRVIVFCFGVLCLCVTIALLISVYLGEPEVLALPDSFPSRAEVFAAGSPTGRFSAATRRRSVMSIETRSGRSD